MSDTYPDWPRGDAYAHLWARIPPDEPWSGITVGPGWARIVLETDAALARIDPDYAIYQVKEKWGLLRYYVSLGEIDDHPAAQAIIREAERRAEHICENCGTEGDHVVHGETRPGSRWYVTECLRCRAVRYPDGGA